MTNAAIENQIITIIENLIGVKVSASESLIESRLVDSMAVIDLTLELEENFNLKIQAFEVKPENYETVKLMAEFIERKQQA